MVLPPPSGPNFVLVRSRIPPARPGTGRNLTLLYSVEEEVLVLVVVSMVVVVVVVVEVVMVELVVVIVVVMVGLVFSLPGVFLV